MACCIHLLLLRVAHFDLAFQEPSLGHIRQVDAHVDHPTLADRAKGQGVLQSLLGLHPEDKVRWVGKLEAADVLLTLKQGERARFRDLHPILSMAL